MQKGPQVLRGSPSALSSRIVVGVIALAVVGLPALMIAGTLLARF